MKTANIALFKRFLFEHGVNTVFKGMYNQYRFEGNPADVEEYLQQVDCQDAILMAFKFPKTMDNYKFGQDYWTNKAVKWDELVAKMTKEGYYSMNQKAVKRFEEEAETPIERFKKGLRDLIKRNYHEQQQEKKREQQLKTIMPRPVVSEEEAVVNDFQPVISSGLKGLNTFKFFDLSKRTSPKMKDDEISISSKKGSYKLTFNKTVSEQVVKAGLTRFRVGQDGITGEVRILFGNFSEEDSMPFTVSKSTNLTIANKSLVGILSNVFSLKESLTTLYLSKNLANSKDYIVFIITRERQ